MVEANAPSEKVLQDSSAIVAHSLIVVPKDFIRLHEPRHFFQNEHQVSRDHPIICQDVRVEIADVHKDHNDFMWVSELEFGCNRRDLLVVHDFMSLELEV